MGTTVTYQAIPEGSELATLLEGDAKAAYLFDFLFNKGGRPFRWEAVRDEVEEEDIAGQSDLFVSQADEIRSFDHLLAVLDRTQREFPDLEDRDAFLEKTDVEIHKALLARVEGSGSGEKDLVDELLYGAETFRFDLKIVPRPVVAAAAKLLEGISPRSLFDPYKTDWLFEDYRDLRLLYLETAPLDEFILIQRNF